MHMFIFKYAVLHMCVCVRESIMKHRRAVEAQGVPRYVRMLSSSSCCSKSPDTISSMLLGCS